MAFSFVKPASDTSKITRWPLSRVDPRQTGPSDRRSAPRRTRPAPQVPGPRPQIPPLQGAPTIDQGGLADLVADLGVLIIRVHATSRTSHRSRGPTAAPRQSDDRPPVRMVARELVTAAGFAPPDRRRYHPHLPARLTEHEAVEETGPLPTAVGRSSVHQLSGITVSIEHVLRIAPHPSHLALHVGRSGSVDKPVDTARRSEGLNVLGRPVAARGGHSSGWSRISGNSGPC